MEFYKRTNHGNKGLISVDRRTKPTLILTIPCFLFKSSTKDLSLPIFEIVIQVPTATTCATRPSQSYDLGRGYRYSFEIGRGDIVASSMDSDLEAFSHNPADGSFAALPFQATA